MADFKTLSGSITLTGGEVSQTFKIEGARVPETPEGIGEYVGKKITDAVSGMGSAKLEAAKSQVSDLTKANAKLAAQLDDAKAELVALKKAKA